MTLSSRQFAVLGVSTLVAGVLTANAPPTSAQAAGITDLVPLPQASSSSSGSVVLTNASEIFFSQAADADVAAALAIDILDSTGLTLTTTLGTGAGSGDVFLDGSGSQANGAYDLTANSFVEIESSDRFGLSNGSSTLLQLLGTSTSVPRGTVSDSPDSQYRGTSVDVARGFWSINDLENLIDVSRLYKLNYLHLHFTDDQNFMFPSTSYPLISADNNNGHAPYSLQQLEDLNDYALARGVVLVPELEMPGHASKLIAAYPSVFGDLGDNMIDYTSPTAVAALETIVDEVADVFEATPYFHIGVDEAPTGGAAFADFLNEMNDHIKSHGKTTVVWEGFDSATAALVDKDIVIAIWEDAKYPAQDALDDGFTLLNSSWQPNYLIDPVWGGFAAPVSSIYTWDKFTFGDYQQTFPTGATTVSSASDVIGGELVSWGSNGDRGLEPLIDRVPAFAARLWNTADETNYGSFTTRAAQAAAVASALLVTDDTLGVREYVDDSTPLGAIVGGSGAGVELAVDSSGHPWALATNGVLWQWTGSAWSQVWTPGLATDFAVGANGTIALITGGDIYKRVGGVWSDTGGEGVSVSVEGDGTIWAASVPGDVWEYSGGTWYLRLSGQGAVAVAAPPSGGDVAAILTGNAISTYDGSTWTSTGGVAVEIAIDSAGDVWTVNADGVMHQLTSSGWTTESQGRSVGGFYDIAIGGGNQFVLSY